MRVEDLQGEAVHGESVEPYIILTGLDDCIVGVIERFGMEPVLLYDTRKVLAKLQKDGMTYEEALEYYSYNIIGGWFGDRTPAFLIEEMNHAERNPPS